MATIIFSLPTDGAKGMRDPKIVGSSKRVLALKEGTKKDQKTATPRVEKSDKTLGVHSSQIWHRYTWL